MRDRRPLPKRIQNAPELWIGSELFYDAFLDLNTCRLSGWSLSPIPWTAIADYARDNDFYGEDREELFYFIREMDRSYLEYCAKKEKSKTK